MASNIVEDGKKVKKMDLVVLNCLMEMFTKEISKEDTKMVMVLKHSKIMINMLETIHTINSIS